MIDTVQKNAILSAEREFERRENLARALAVAGITLVGRITSPPDPGVGAADAAATSEGRPSLDADGPIA